ncbi:MAG: Fpg/Nei family DNA glycosylase [Microbacteriaceae bacterium]|nr:Fpg/Nei family DNA glycosylase [Microbacteriaceae bacterium]
MPEGHSVHRIARQFQRNFVGRRVTASSPQGRFETGAAELDGIRMLAAFAVGKQLFIEFEHDRWLRVHLGLYGAWDFAGKILSEAAFAAAQRRIKTRLDTLEDDAGENSPHSIGAPRLARIRMAEEEKLSVITGNFPADPVGAVRVRLLTTTAVADLRGPTACEVLDGAEVRAVMARLGPDPLVDDAEVGEERFATKVLKKPTPIGLLLMDQSVVSGIGNVYRAELLFRNRLNPKTPGKLIPEELVRELWKDWSRLLVVGVKLGQMMTMDDLDEDGYRAALVRRDSRHWVYHRTGLPCRICRTPIAMELAATRKLYWCPSCQE